MKREKLARLRDIVDEDQASIEDILYTIKYYKLS